MTVFANDYGKLRNRHLQILMHSPIEMNREQTIRLIKRYGEQRLLWDNKHPKHLNIERRRESWTIIANDFTLPIGGLKKKMASLLGSHRRELHRERKSRIRAASTGTKYIYSSKWFGYPYFDFLRKNKINKQVKIRHTKPMDDSQPPEQAADEDTDASVTEVQESHPTYEVEHVMTLPPPQPPRKKRQYRSPEPDDVETESECEEENTSRTQSLKYLQNAFNDANDPYVIFGNYIASELRKYDPRTLACVKHAIHNVIFEADLGKIQVNTSNHSAHQPSQSSSSFVTEMVAKISPVASDASSS